MWPVLYSVGDSAWPSVRTRDFLSEMRWCWGRTQQEVGHLPHKMPVSRLWRYPVGNHEVFSGVITRQSFSHSSLAKWCYVTRLISCKKKKMLPSIVNVMSSWSYWPVANCYSSKKMKPFLIEQKWCRFTRTRSCERRGSHISQCYLDDFFFTQKEYIN